MATGAEETTGTFTERFAPAVRFATKTAAWTAELADANKVYIYTGASDVAFTVPPNADVALPVGTSLDVIETGAGHVTVTAGSGVSFEGTTVATTAAHPHLRALKIATNTWAVYGQ